MSKAETTRLEILKKAFALIYQKGYQATSIDDIIATTQVTKGAFYYHFKNKEEMGIALITDLMNREFLAVMGGEPTGNTNFRDELFAVIKGLLIDHSFLTAEFGCPAVNLIQEMAPLNEHFRNALKKSIAEWQHTIEAVIRRGQDAGQLSKEQDSKQIALSVITQYHGVRTLGKVLGNAYYKSFLEDFRRYLNNLK
jgi:TetR/AcrR family transcriptional repressor of nem operon